MIDFPAVVDSSMLNDFRNCPQKFFRKNLQHWKRQGESVHLHAGAAFAKGLETARHAFYEAGKDSELAIGMGLEALAQFYGDFTPPEFGSGAAKTKDRMLGALEFYFAEWPLGAGAEPHKMPSGKYAIEFSFAHPLPFINPQTGDPVIYCGRSDMICDFAGGLYVEDDKTASALGETWAKQWDLRSQFTGYCWAARETGHPVNGVLVRGVSILKTKYGRADAITYRPAWQIERWLGQVLRDLARIREMWADGDTEAVNWDYALDDACNNYGGCEFREVCASEAPDEWLPMSFERRRWDPLERTETLLEKPCDSPAF
jgi:PD-(D/E)XK nuclease superfamily